MSVIMTLSIAGNPEAMEQYAKDHPEQLHSIVEAAKRHGLIAHRFYGSENGQVMALDEWPDRQSFEAFFAEQQPAIGPMMEAVGVTAQPEATFWHELATDDSVGWGA
jgi:hypothetical protein